MSITETPSDTSDSNSDASVVITPGSERGPEDAKDRSLGYDADVSPLEVLRRAGVC